MVCLIGKVARSRLDEGAAVVDGDWSALRLVFSIGLLDPAEAAGGGELRREVRCRGFELLAAGGLFCFGVLLASDAVSFCEEEAMLEEPAADKALWMAAAEGTVGLLAPMRVSS